VDNKLLKLVKCKSNAKWVDTKGTEDGVKKAEMFMPYSTTA